MCGTESYEDGWSDDRKMPDRMPLGVARISTTVVPAFDHRPFTDTESQRRAPST